jgi:hypothetical protein
MKSFDQVFAERGIHVQREIRCMKQRTRYAQHLDRPKYFSDDGVPTCSMYRGVDQKEIDLAKADLVAANDTAAYVKAWVLLNHLTK